MMEVGQTQDTTATNSMKLFLGAAAHVVAVPGTYNGLAWGPMRGAVAHEGPQTANLLFWDFF